MNASTLSFLIEKYALSEDEFNDIFKTIIRIYTAGILPVNNPTVIILGAQPGAGKTELQGEAELRLLNNAVICNADNFRDFHPLFKEIKRYYEDEYPIITANCAQRWNDMLCLYCQEHKLNYILETTFSSGDRLNQTISEIKKAGYQVDIKLLAVDPHLSRLGIHLRYEDMLSKTTIGRKVSRMAHDSRFEAIPDAIKSVQSSQLYDNLYLYARSIVIEGTEHIDGVTLIAHNPIDPLAVYLEELKRPWSERAKLNFENRCNKVLLLMEQRNAPIKEINSFKENVGLREPKQLRKSRGIRR
jgi:predicted ABC-type ATPase